MTESPDYQYFFNNEAIKLVKLIEQENNRIKASRMYKTACNMEKAWRKYRGISDYATVLSGGCIHKASPLWMIIAASIPPHGGSAVKQVIHAS